MTGYSKSEEAIAALTPEQFRVTQRNGTERPGSGALLGKKEPGIYVDVVSGEPLFASTDKYESGSGWPSFTRPLEAGNVSARRDWSMLIPRTEIRSVNGDSHLGHVFKDGPRARGGLRYCINSAALRFVARADMAAQGYAEYLDQIDEAPSETRRAVLAGGCFWGMQDLIRNLPGVVSTRVGYSGGDVPSATYRRHGSHAEAVEIVYDPRRTDFRALLEFFFQIHDPTTVDRQGNDRGTSYRSAIFYADVEASGLWPGKVVTEVAPLGDFWEAEPEHQDYLLRRPNGYTCHFARPKWKLPRRVAAAGASAVDGQISG